MFWPKFYAKYKLCDSKRNFNKLNFTTVHIFSRSKDTVEKIKVIALANPE